ncbi:hypothetical protein OBBRIDRAFT_884541 [Obba rivulosa]|uniref:Uncharacterized protein n=1 Tax=Obba rivulosa TaxID=1052685 RepID=A0A8E2DRX3_9APHY|nr:hypothetical protein OBBRIDRAFT_884541 [Obba rivulosa]
MLGSWLSSKSTSDRKPAPPPPTQSLDTPLRASLKDAEPQTAARPSAERVVTAALSTPHDAVLAELHRDHGAHPAPTPVHGAPASLLTLAADSGTTDRSNTASPSAAPRSVASSPDHSRDTLHDPFTGAVLGALPPTSGKDRAREPGSAQLEQSKDELWAHLARIRELQSEIAGMHVQMEGPNEARASRRAATDMSRVHTDTISGDEWDNTDDADQHRKDAQDAEFTKLAKMFEGRRAAIDGIMNKLDDLSKSLTTFHALPNPTMDFTSSRSATRDSSGLPPIQSRFSTMDMPASPTATSATSPITTGRTPNILVSQPDGSDPVLFDSPVDIQNRFPAKSVTPTQRP